MSTPLCIFDTTLRDGTQGEGISLTAEDKVKIALKLDALGIHYIEGGNPGSNSKDIEFFRRIRELKLQSKLTAFGSTRRKNISCDQDVNLKHLLESGAQAATLVGKTWDFHVHTALQTTLEENLAMIYESLAFINRGGMEALFDAEHFFDGYRANPDYALACIRAAHEAGAKWIVLC
ncbi:MAG: citramalate synthase, partial [Cohnella sp.]|nr:citramalate synthase [Cohnella sp.]